MIHRLCGVAVLLCLVSADWEDLYRSQHGSGGMIEMFFQRGLCLDAGDRLNWYAGGNVYLYSCSNSTQQMWRVHKMHRGREYLRFLSIEHEPSGLCLDMRGEYQRPVGRKVFAQLDTCGAYRDYRIMATDISSDQFWQVNHLAHHYTGQGMSDGFQLANYLTHGCLEADSKEAKEFQKSTHYFAITKTCEVFFNRYAPDSYSDQFWRFVPSNSRSYK